MDEKTTEIINRFFIEIGIINQLSNTLVESCLPGRMSSTQFGILGHLARRPSGETPLQLAHAFQVPKTTMTHMLAGLEAQGLIELRANTADKRSKIAASTPKGFDFLVNTTSKIVEVFLPALEGIDPKVFADSLPNLEIIREKMDTARDK